MGAFLMVKDLWSVDWYFATVRAISPPCHRLLLPLFIISPALMTLLQLRAHFWNFAKRMASVAHCLLAFEGINGTIAGPRAGIDAALAHIRAMPGCAEFEHGKKAKAANYAFSANV